MNSQDLIKVAKKAEFAEQNIDKRANLLATFHMMKDKTPFSQRLNNWISLWFLEREDNFIFTDTDDFGDNIKETLRKHIERYRDTGKIHIWTGESEGTIFGDAKINHYFRAWHDYTHITHELGYDFAGESIVGSIQASELPIEWVFERELINIEILGQNQYYNRHKEFLKDQRQFSIDYLNDPVKAVMVKQGSIDLRKSFA